MRTLELIRLCIEFLMLAFMSQQEDISDPIHEANCSPEGFRRFIEEWKEYQLSNIDWRRRYEELLCRYKSSESDNDRISRLTKENEALREKCEVLLDTLEEEKLKGNRYGMPEMQAPFLRHTKSSVTLR